MTFNFFLMLRVKLGTVDYKFYAVAPSDLIVRSSVSQTFLLKGPFWLRKITTNHHILAHVNIDCPDDRYPKLNICISEMILDSYAYIPVAYVTMHCMI
jgi:hypothetical protein